MSRPRHRSVVVTGVVVGSALLAVAACTKPPEPLPPRPIPQPGANQDSINKWRADSAARADSIRAALAREKEIADSLALIREQEQRAAAEAQDVMKVITAPVYFDYDQSALTDAGRSLLDAKVPILQARRDIKLLITGHTDERGSSEYNIALGLRRAAEVQEYLIASGIDASRLEITSMGAERPAVIGTGEVVWSQNRRAEFSITSGDSN